MSYGHISFLVTASFSKNDSDLLSTFTKNALFYDICLPLKCQTKIAADDILIFYYYLSKKIRLDFSCETLQISSLIAFEKQ